MSSGATPFQRILLMEIKQLKQMAANTAMQVQDLFWLLKNDGQYMI